jgi:hypothetical protein
MNTFKKLSATMMMAALMAGFTACSSDEDTLTTDDVAGEAIAYNITCVAPSPAITSRAYSDGQTADNLWYALYVGDLTAGSTDTTYTLVASNFNIPEYSASATTMGTSTLKFNSDARPKVTIHPTLITGKRYMLIAFGAADNAPYVIDRENKTLKVIYTDALCNDENRDAFYKKVTFLASKKNATSMTVTLTRPFAQVNVGTRQSDWDSADAQGAAPTQTQFVVKKAYDTLNLVDGTVSGEVTATFALNTIPDATHTFPYTGSEEVADPSGQDDLKSVQDVHYRYLSMIYVLLCSEKQTFDCTFTTDVFAASNDELTFANVPMQRNHRTNIYGDAILALNTAITFEIDPDYLSDDYDYTGALLEDGEDFKLNDALDSSSSPIQTKRK